MKDAMAEVQVEEYQLAEEAGAEDPTKEATRLM